MRSLLVASRTKQHQLTYTVLFDGEAAVSRQRKANQHGHGHETVFIKPVTCSCPIVATPTTAGRRADLLVRFVAGCRQKSCLFFWGLVWLAPSASQRQRLSAELVGGLRPWLRCSARKSRNRKKRANFNSGLSVSGICKQIAAEQMQVQNQKSKNRGRRCWMEAGRLVKVSVV